MTRPTDALLSLLHLCDSLFPIGSFAYSDGLESAAAGGRVTGTAISPRGWRSALEEGFGRSDGPAIVSVMAGRRGRGLGGGRRDRRRAHGAAGLFDGAPGQSIDGAAPAENLAGTAPRCAPRADAGDSWPPPAWTDAPGRVRGGRLLWRNRPARPACRLRVRAAGGDRFRGDAARSRSDRRTLTSCSVSRWRGCRPRSTSSWPGRRVRNRSLRHSTSRR